jgi:ABC-type transport system involved in multi-copper enzyme maturation permease subunit
MTDDERYSLATGIGMLIFVLCYAATVLMSPIILTYVSGVWLVSVIAFAPLIIACTACCIASMYLYRQRLYRIFYVWLAVIYHRCGGSMLTAFKLLDKAEPKE